MFDLIPELFKDARRVHMKRGQTLFYTDDPVTRMYAVADGDFDLTRYLTSGSQIRLQRATSGTIIAEASAYNDAYHCDGVAASPVTLLSLPRATFRSRLDQNCDLAREWASRLATGLQSARTNAEVRSLRTVAERLDAWLSGGKSIPPKGERQELANVLGVSREALYREIAKR